MSPQRKVRPLPPHLIDVLELIPTDGEYILAAALVEKAKALPGGTRLNFDGSIYCIRLLRRNGLTRERRESMGALVSYTRTPKGTLVLDAAHKRPTAAAQ